jgi:hypothetical protein
VHERKAQIVIVRGTNHSTTYHSTTSSAMLRDPQRGTILRPICGWENAGEASLAAGNSPMER